MPIEVGGTVVDVTTLLPQFMRTAIKQIQDESRKDEDDPQKDKDGERVTKDESELPAHCKPINLFLFCTSRITVKM